MIPTLPSSEQSESTLMQLPVEIRLTILRLLLVHRSPLLARKRGKRKRVQWSSARPGSREELVAIMSDTTAVSYDLHPALLATCQALYEQGRLLLYGTNTIGLRFYGSSVILYAALKMIDPSETESSPTEAIEDQLVELIRRFNKIHIDITYDSNGERVLKDLILGMEGVLSGKDVQVQFVYPLHYEDGKLHETGPSDDENWQMSMEDQLRHFRLIRCKNFRVLDTALDPFRVSRIVDVVTSDEPVVNLWPSFRDFEEYFLALSAFCYYSEPSYNAHYMLEDHDQYFYMEEAAAECDAAYFRRVRATWMKAIDEDYERRTRLAFRNDQLHMIE